LDSIMIQFSPQLKMKHVIASLMLTHHRGFFYVGLYRTSLSPTVPCGYLPTGLTDTCQVFASRRSGTR